nr:phosphate ABC transporter permease PstA [Bowmanella yangjiangensis]
MASLDARRKTLAQIRLLLVFDTGEHYHLPLADVEKYLQINQQGNLQKFATFLGNVWEFVSDTPKRANSAGGVFPALFGTVVMVLLMTVIVTPLGVMAAIYLNEYAPNNSVTSLIRIGVNNLAGVPSIVYGVFGLGFFVYQVGGNIDKLFFSEHLPAPTFGAPGIFWAALTMAMLTLPVVIVATEEGLRRVPDSLRQGSYALGATQFETLWRTVIPMASPGIMTGVILAIARGAGEVAPLLLVGAVKFAPTLPVDMEFPYLHLDRQFMHLGVLIYDGAFHSNSIGHGSSMMFASCLLLLLVVLSLNIVAVVVRAKLRRQYQAMAGQG